MSKNIDVLELSPKETQALVNQLAFEVEQKDREINKLKEEDGSNKGVTMTKKDFLVIFNSAKKSLNVIKKCASLGIIPKENVEDIKETILDIYEKLQEDEQIDDIETKDSPIKKTNKTITDADKSNKDTVEVTPTKDNSSNETIEVDEVDLTEVALNGDSEQNKVTDEGIDEFVFDFEEGEEIDF